MGDLGMEEDRPILPSFAAPLNNPDPNSIRVEAWVVADDPTREVLNCIHPNLDSEEKRKDVIEFVQKLIGCNLRLEVFPYGSVPLKTYLPDGDIDLTVISTPNLDEILPHEVLRVLLEEEKNGNAEFQLKDTQFIDAEVKLVKCLVQDIVIDISFNQLGGLCTLCFLEQVDRLAGKDHIFKRSIILIKAWCYYESRILGAHHGLISTYALETLVLYIFHVFHASLSGPIEVLYRFLDYYAKFDWDNYCVSLDGPVRKSSLPNLAGETQEFQGNNVLLGAEFRKNCMDMFIVPCKGGETDLRAFNLKNLNIIDPLKENNNLGRSVHKGNYYRIRSAFRYGARRLGKILQLPYNKIGDEIKKFFKNTLQRHKPKYMPGSTLVFDANGFGNLSISSRSEIFYEDDMYSKFSNGDCDDYMNDVSTVGSLKNDQNAPSYKGSSVDEKTGLELLMDRGVGSEVVDGDTICLCINNNNNNSLSDNLSLDSIVETEFLSSFSDLTGDYDAHIRNLFCSQSCHGHALSTTVIRTSPPSSPYGNRNTSDLDTRSLTQNSGSLVNANGALMGNHTYLLGNHRTSSNVAVRGTGPYIPNTNCNTCKDRQPPATRGRGRGRGPPISNGHSQRARGRFGERNLVIEANHTSQTHLEWSPKQAHTNATISQQTQQQTSQVNSTTNGHASQIQPEWSSKRAHANATLSTHTHQNSSQVNSTTNGHASEIQPELSPKRAHTNATLSTHTHQNSSQVDSTTNGHASEIQPELSPKRAHTNATSSSQTNHNSSQVNSTTNGHASQIQPEWSSKQAHANAITSNQTHQNSNQVNSASTGRAIQIQPELSPKQPHVNTNLSNQTQHIPSQIKSTTDGLVNQSRKLEFGSFRSRTENSSETGASPPFVSSPKLNAFSTKQGRIGDNSFHLKNEDEFPPLSAS